MKKQLIQLAVVAAALVAALAAFLLLRGGEDELAEDTPAEETYVVGGSPQPFVKTLAISNEADAFTVRNDAGSAEEKQDSAESAFSIEGLDSATLNQTLLQSAVNAAAALPAKKVVAESGGDLALYGLDSSRAVIDITYADSSARLVIGDEAPGQEGTYVSNDLSAGAVYLVESTKLTNLLGSRLSFVSKTITPGNSQSTQFEKVALSGAALEQPIEIERAEDTEASAMAGFSNYKLTAPIQSGADSQSGVAVLQGVYGLAAMEVVESAKFQGTAAASYGLDEPYLRAEVTTLNSGEEGAEPVAPFTVVFSAPDADGNVYVQCSAADYIYRISESSAPFLSLRLFDYQEKLVILPHIDAVSEVEVTAGDEAHTFQLEGEGDGLTVSLNGEALDTENFRRFYQTLLAARYEEEIDSGEPEYGEEASSDEFVSPLRESEAQGPPAPPEGAQIEDPYAGLLLQFTYRYRDGSTDSVVRFMPGPARRALVALDGGRAYYTQSIYVDRVLDDLAKIVAGEEVKSYY